MRPYIFTALLLTLISVSAFAQLTEVFSTEEGAIRGYDPVAFFTESKALPGKKEFQLDWNGSLWLFSSAENMAAFKTEPEKYVPQFGGYCAYGIAAGYKSPTETETWTIVDNKLYFSYNVFVQKLFNKNRKGLIDQANRNWPVTKKKEDYSPTTPLIK